MTTYRVVFALYPDDMAIEFEWDAAKAEANLVKHRVSFDEATSAFYDALSLTIPDPDHSVNEERFTAHWHDRDQASCGGRAHRPRPTHTHHQCTTGDPP